MLAIRVIIEVESRVMNHLCSASKCYFDSMFYQSCFIQIKKIKVHDRRTTDFSPEIKSEGKLHDLGINESGES